ESGDDSGDKADPHLGVAELRFGHRQREVAEQGKASASGDRGAVDSGDSRLGEFVDCAEEARHRTRVFEVLLGRAAEEAFEIFQVHTGAESLARAGEDEDASGRGFNFFKGAKQVFDQFVADGITLVGTVESESGDTRVEGELKGGVGTHST